jgi:SAM-dependent methyltransferase
MPGPFRGVAFGGVASRYDDELWKQVPDDPGSPHRHVAELVRSLGPAGRALDLGCGDGRLGAELDAAELVAADVSPVALERAGRRLPAARLVELDPDAPLPFPDSTFDLVLCAETLEHVRDLQLLLSEARRVLRPGGELALTTPAHGRLTGLAILLGGFERRFDPLSPHLHFLTRRSLRALLDELGFEVHSLRRRSGTILARATR